MIKIIIIIIYEPSQSFIFIVINLIRSLKKEKKNYERISSRKPVFAQRFSSTLSNKTIIFKCRIYFLSSRNSIYIRFEKNLYLPPYPPSLYILFLYFVFQINILLYVISCKYICFIYTYIYIYMKKIIYRKIYPKIFI